MRKSALFGPVCAVYSDRSGSDTLIVYARVSKADGSQLLDLQRDALIDAGVANVCIYEDRASGRRGPHSGLEACMKASQPDNTFVVRRLDRPGPDLKHLVTTVDDLCARGVGEVVPGNWTVCQGAFRRRRRDTR